jgi:actin-related protein 10
VERVLTEGCTAASSRTTSNVPMDAMDIDDSEDRSMEDEVQLAKDLKDRYSSQDLPSKSFRIPHSPSARDGTGTLVVPGWILERAAEILFEREDDLESETVPEAMLATLLKVSCAVWEVFKADPQLPVDLRHTMISTILVVGGTSSLPNYIPRLRDTILDALRPKSAIQGTLSLAQWKKRNEEPYRELYGLSSRLAIINDPKPVDGRGGTGPRWTPGLMSWVGGSLAGYVS